MGGQETVFTTPDGGYSLERQKDLIESVQRHCCLCKETQSIWY